MKIQPIAESCSPCVLCQMAGKATAENLDEALTPLLALCDERGLRWSWRTTPDGDHWKATVKVEEFGEFGWVTLAWLSADGLSGELKVLVSAVRYVLDHIAQRDKQLAEGEAYQRRIAAGARRI